MPSDKWTILTHAHDIYGAGLYASDYTTPWEDLTCRPPLERPRSDYRWHVDTRNPAAWKEYEVLFQVTISGASGTGHEVNSFKLRSVCLYLVAHMPEAGLHEAMQLLSGLWNRFQPVNPDMQSSEAKFYDLALQLFKGIGSSSDPGAIFSHPSYRAIVEMGQDAVPYLREELAKRPSPLSCAYAEITGQRFQVAGPRKSFLKMIGWTR